MEILSPELRLEVSENTGYTPPRTPEYWWWGLEPYVKVYTARKTKLRILSLLWLRLFGLNLLKFPKSLMSSAG